MEGSGAGQLHLSPELARLFESAEKIAEKAGDSYVTAERLLLALALAKGTPSARILADAGVAAQTLNAAINDLRKGRTADSANAETLWTLIATQSSEVDLAVYRAPALEAAFRRALAEGFAQGAAGFARDFVLATGTWPFDFTTIRVPVHLWYGAHDTSTVHSPDHGAELARRIPGARRRLIPEAGGALLWTHAEAILSALLSA